MSGVCVVAVENIYLNRDMWLRIILNNFPSYFATRIFLLLLQFTPYGLLHYYKLLNRTFPYATKPSLSDKIVLGNVCVSLTDAMTAASAL